MNKFLRNIAVSTVLATAFTVTTANAMDDAEAKAAADHFMATAQAYVQSAVGGSGNVLVKTKGDVAILVGYVESQIIRNIAEKAALQDPKINSVENHLQTSN